MRRTTAIFCAVFAISIASQATANNNLFLPGDAFFYAEPNHEWFEKLATTDLPELTYQMPRNGTGGRFCGYAGHDKLRLQNMSPEFRANLLKAYQELRARYPQRIEVHQEATLKMVNGKLVPVGDSKKTRTEHNLVSMVIYNRSFDLEKFHPLFRYNENWADVAASFGHQRDHVAHDFFLEDVKSITDEWRDSPLVPPLKIVEPPRDPKTGRRVNQPISVDSGGIQILLFPSTSYRDMAFPTEKVVIQDHSGSMEVLGQTSGGGLFSVQDSVENVHGERQSLAQDAESADDDSERLNKIESGEEANDEVPYFAYRATKESAQILKPNRKRWVVSETIGN